VEDSSGLRKAVVNHETTAEASNHLSPDNKSSKSNSPREAFQPISYYKSSWDMFLRRFYFIRVSDEFFGSTKYTLIPSLLSSSMFFSVINRASCAPVVTAEFETFARESSFIIIAAISKTGA